MFDAPMPGGAGLAILHDGEMILNRQQQAAVFGGAGDVNVYVSQTNANPYDIGRELAWAMRVTR